MPSGWRIKEANTSSSNVRKWGVQEQTARTKKKDMIALEQNVIYSRTILDYMFDSNQTSTVLFP